MVWLVKRIPICQDSQCIHLHMDVLGNPSANRYYRRLAAQRGLGRLGRSKPAGNSAPISSAAARYSGRLPELEPQKTQVRLMQTF